MVFFTIVTACVNLFRSILTAILYPFTSQAAIANNQSQRLRAQEPRAAAAQFKRDFEEKYGTLHPDFFEGGYLQALEQAKSELRFLMVILQTDEHDNTEKFNNETLTSQILISFLRENNVLVWAGNIKDAEAYTVNNKLEATTYPFAGIIVLQTPQSGTGVSGKMVLVDRIEGFSTPDTLIAHLTNQINLHDSGLQLIRNERTERDSARQIREQQDYAYLASLQADQEKERKARETAEAQRLAEEHARKKEAEFKSLSEKKEIWRRWALNQLPDEPITSEKNIARLVFKLRNGERLIRNFRGNESVEAIYTFVDTYHLRTELTSTSPSSPPNNYVHTFDFLLVSPYPRTIHHPDSQKTIKEEPGLWPSAQLHVEGLVEESEEE
ncbi:hypothetical protein G9A89_002600 [Geosiphon pyriformis]|nr:hypothetical protein G9A89_002600 [Geosiphon pyriformis]